ncbi:MAG: 2,3-bisphosphoglycerate-independent phosphoglycerate mutase [Dehalococcoidia bacterium]
MQDELLREIVTPAHGKIVLMVLDGLGGLPHPETRRSELETADIPHLDRLASESACGLTVPVAPGVTPGSGPGHLALFGYDPVASNIGRGVLEAVGIEFPLGPNDVAARGNFCTLDPNGLISDRRAGRISTEKCADLCAKLRQIELPGVEALIEPVREHRFVLVLRAENLSDALAPLGTDPQQEGLAPVPVEARAPEAEATARLFNDWIVRAAALLRDEAPANFPLVRGFAKIPHLRSMQDRFGIRPAAVAIYPMYRGLAKLAGMEILSTGQTFEDELATVAERWDEYDFFFVHYKKTDAAGEDGDFMRKVHALEEFDQHLPRVLELKPDVLMIAGDHSTPAIMAAHSWHPVPFLLHAAFARPGDANGFNELECLKGSLGTFPAQEAMQLALAHAGRFTKFGA